MESIHKKSQSATEFIMNYGWAFLIVLIVIFSLIYFGILDPYQFLPEKAELGEGVDIVDASVDENSISFILRNTMGRDIYDFQINATGCNDGNGTLSTAVDIPEGKTKKITIYCEHDYAVGSKIDSGLEALWKTRTSTKGERYDFDQKTTGIVKVTVNKGKELYDREGISACGTLNLTKTIYILQDNISTTGTCLNISVDDVEIDGNGLSITGGGESTNYGILNYGNRRNITIKNFGNIINFSKGIYLDNVNDSSVQNNTIDFNCSQDTYGFYLGSMSSNQIINNTIDLYCPDDYSLAGLLVNYQYFNNNTINDNSIELYTLAVDSSAFGMRFLGTSDFGYNVIQNNLINISYSDNSGYGIQGAGGSNCTISDNAIWIRAFSVAEGIKFTGANNFTFHNLTLNIHKTTDALWGTGLYLSNVWSSNLSSLTINTTTPTIPLRVADIRVSGSNNNFSNSTLYGVGYPIYSYSGSVNNTFLNVTYNNTNEFMPAGALLTRKWYYKTYVEDSNSLPLSGANVIGYDKYNRQRFNMTTDSNGFTGFGEMIDYVNYGGTRNYSSNYTITAAYSNSVGYHQDLNVSVTGNTLDDTITIDIVQPLISFSGGTPSDGSSQSENYIYANVSISDSSSYVSSIVDIDDTLISWWRMDDFETESVVGSGTVDSIGPMEQTRFVDFDEDLVPYPVPEYSNGTYKINYTSGPLIGQQYTIINSRNGSSWHPGNDFFQLDPDPGEDTTGDAFDIIGFKVVDYMGRNNGTIINTTLTDSGRMGKGFFFSGINASSININHSSSLNLTGTTMSFSAWVQSNKNDVLQGVFSKLQYTSPPPYHYGYGMHKTATNTYGCRFSNGAPTGVYSTDTFTDTGWHHIVCTLTSGGIPTIYVDGIENGTSSPTGTTNNSGIFYIGKMYNNRDEYYWNGTIDDVMIFNRTLSAEEVYGLYANTSSKYYGANLTYLASADHTFKAYVQDTSGNVNSTEERTVTVS